MQRISWGLVAACLAGCGGGGGSSTASSSSSASVAASSGGSSGTSHGASGSTGTTTTGSTGTANTSTTGTVSSSNGSTAAATSASASSSSGSPGSSSSGSTGTTGASSILLVNNDGNTAPSTNSDTSQPVFSAWLTALPAAFTTYPEPSDGSDLSDPTNAALASVTTIVWFTGSESGSTDPTISPDQQTTLAAWLDQGGHTLILFSDYLVSDLSVGGMGWMGPEGNPFLANYVGATGDSNDPNDAKSGTDLDSDVPLVVTGGTGAFAAMTWDVTSGTDSAVAVNAEGINPAAGVDVLATVAADPASTGTNVAMPVIVGNKHAGALGTSTVVFVGISIENVQSGVTGVSDQSQLLAAIASYAGLP